MERLIIIKQVSYIRIRYVKTIFAGGKEMKDVNEIVLFETEDKEIKLNVPVEQETVWLTQAQMTELGLSRKVCKFIPLTLSAA